MHPRSTDRPTQAQLVFPLLETIADNGGRVTPIEAATALADRFGLEERVRNDERRTSNGQVVDLWRRHVRFAKQKAKEMGYVSSTSERGVWELTDAGRKGLSHATPALVVEVLTDLAGRPRAARIDLCVGVPTTHLIAHGDSRRLDWIADDEIPLVVTSCPYFDLKAYDDGPGQLAAIESYEAFLAAMDDVLRECLRVLMPGGRLALNVGDVLRSRAQHGEHHVLPLHADLLVRSRALGFRTLNGIIWRKKTNCAYEGAGRGTLGRPGQPNGIIKSEAEHILLMRKPGPYRSVSHALARASHISQSEYDTFFQQVWDIPGARADRGHPAPFPIEIPYRLIRMFSHANDTVLDVFGGSATTALGAAKAGRNSICVDAAHTYVARAIERVGRGDIELACA